MQTDLSVEVAKVVLLILMFLVAGAAIFLNRSLNALIHPISRQLIELHKGDSGTLEPRLQYIRHRYIALLNHVDAIDTAEFSAGEIERLSLRLLGREITAASAHSWILQAPGILISFGLLGTFWGLTVGLGQISGALSPGATPQQTMAALSAIVAPMGTAFETSLVGLLLSLLVLIMSQLSGARTCLERCESLLSSWLETVLPQELGDKLMTPLKRSLEGLNDTSRLLPSAVAESVEKAMQAAFAEKLAKMFNLNTTIASEAQQATRQLSAVANNLSECGQDFVMAANAFRQSNFPEALRESVSGLLESKERLTVSTDVLSDRLQEVRDGLMAMQGQWQLLAKSAEAELQASRIAALQIQQGLAALQASSQALEEGTQVVAVAAKQLKETRLEVMRDRKLSIDVAESVRDRLAVDSSAIETCQVFASALETALTKWNENVNQLDRLREVFINAALSGRSEDMDVITTLKLETQETIRSLRASIDTDLGAAISSKVADLERLGEPLSRAQVLGSGVIQQLMDLQASLNPTADAQGRQGDWGQGGNTQ